MRFDAFPYAHPSGVRRGLGELTHQALIYGSDAEFLAGALPVLHCGVERSEPMVAITDPAKAELLRAALGPQAAVTYIDSADWFRVPGWVFGEFHRFVRQNGSTRLWVLTEPPWGGWTAATTLEWQRCESILNVAFGWAPASVVCAYDRRVLAPEIAEDALCSHPAIVHGERVAGSPRYMQPVDYAATHRVPIDPAPESADVLKFEVSDLATVRAVAADWARREVLSEAQVRDLLIAVHEIASNAVEHGGGTGLIRLWSTEEALHCEVSSEGALSQPFPGYLPPDTGQERGRGLWMARQICTSVHVQPNLGGGVDVRITVPRAEAGSPA